MSYNKIIFTIRNANECKNKYRKTSAQEEQEIVDDIIRNNELFKEIYLEAFEENKFFSFVEPDLSRSGSLLSTPSNIYEYVERQTNRKYGTFFIDNSLSAYVQDLGLCLQYIDNSINPKTGNYETQEVFISFERLREMLYWAWRGLLASKNEDDQERKEILGFYAHSYFDINAELIEFRPKGLFRKGYRKVEVKKPQSLFDLEKIVNDKIRDKGYMITILPCPLYPDDKVTFDCAFKMPKNIKNKYSTECIVAERDFIYSLKDKDTFIYEQLAHEDKDKFAHTISRHFYDIGANLYLLKIPENQ